MVFAEVEGTPSTHRNEDSEEIAVYLMDRGALRDLLKYPDIVFGARAWLVMDAFVRMGKGYLTGLNGKYYFLAPDGTRAGGVYLWQSRQDAERFYTEQWRTFVRDKYGSDAVLTYLETPVIVDNVSNEIISLSSPLTQGISLTPAPGNREDHL